MGYWKSTVIPKFKKIFEKNNVKKTATAEACKSFNDAKEDYSKEFEEKKDALQTKVIEIYEASAGEIKAMVKERKDGGLKKASSGIEKFLEELSKIEFPGSNAAHEACCKFGATLVEGPIFFVFEKVSTFIVVEEALTLAPASTLTPAPTPAEMEETSNKEKEIMLEEKNEEANAEEVASDPPKAC